MGHAGVIIIQGCRVHLLIYSVLPCQIGILQQGSGTVGLAGIYAEPMHVPALSTQKRGSETPLAN